MKRSRLAWIAVTAVILALVSTLWVGAVPILGSRKPSLPSEVMSLAGLNKVSVALYPLPTELVEAGASHGKILGDFRSTLKNSGLKVVAKNPDARIVLKVMSASHGRHKGAVGISVIMAVHQKVRVTRIDRDEMVLPTMSLSKLAVVPIHLAATGLASEVRVISDQLVTLVRRATQR